MNTRTVRVSIDDYVLQYTIEGETTVGGDECLFENDDNLIDSKPWAKQGYTVEPFLSKAKHDTILEGIRRIIHGEVNKVVPTELASFRLDKYHEAVRDTGDHMKIVNQTREGFPLENFPIAIAELEKRVSEICGVEVTALNPYLPDEKVFYIRVIRPNSNFDNNPPHRDVWLNFLRNCVNIYVPIAGSNMKSSLPLLPGSHLWKESELERTTSASKVNGLAYRVPALAGLRRDGAMIRPNPGPNEVMVFTPYLVHGGGINLNTDLTRMSLEMRFWRK